MTPYNFLPLPKYITSRYWYLKPTLNLYVYLLSKATYIEKTTINNIVLNKHQILTSSKALESALKLTSREVRTALEHLKKTGDIEIITTNKYSIITLLFEENDKQKTGDEALKIESQEENKKEKRQTKDKNDKQNDKQKTGDEDLKIESPNNSRKLKTTSKTTTSIDNIDNNNILVDFQKFWENYPLQKTRIKGSKEKSKNKYKSLRKEGITKEELNKALEYYKEVLKTNPWQQSKRVEGWLEDWKAYKQEDYSKQIEVISQIVKAIEPLASIQVNDKKITINMLTFISYQANKKSIEDDIKQHCKDIDFQYSFTANRTQND